VKLNKVKGVELSVANALWIANDFAVNRDFVGRAQELLAEARNLDFVNQIEQSRHTINSWVEHKTKDKIKDLLPPGYSAHNTHTLKARQLIVCARVNAGLSCPALRW
jgi:serpin B